MNYIFFILIFFSIIFGIFNNTLDKVVAAMFEGCNLAIKIAFSLIGIMSFWLGLLKIAEKSGLIKILSKILYPFVKFLFKDLKKDSNAIGDIAMSLGANALGLTNAATPIGLKVMEELQKENPNKEIATDSMCMFLSMNTAGFQIIPTTIIAILVGIGANNPTEIIFPTFIVTSLSFLIAIISALIIKNIWKNKEIE